MPPNISPTVALLCPRKIRERKRMEKFDHNKFGLRHGAEARETLQDNTDILLSTLAEVRIALEAWSEDMPQERLDMFADLLNNAYDMMFELRGQVLGDYFVYTFNELEF